MPKITLTIRQKLMLAFGGCAASTLVTGIIGISGILHLEPISASRYNLPIAGIVAAVAVGFVACAYAAVHLTAQVCGGLYRMAAKFDAIATSLDLSARSPLRRHDEFRRGFVAFDKWMKRMDDTMVAVRSATDAVRMATRDISVGNLNLSARTEQQAAALSETASSMTQLTETVKQNANSAHEANSLAMDATKIAGTGGEIVHAMVATIDKIHGNSNKISQITSVIESIAFQTNILALNAAVEAARAGEQGRGFAVVASEVRSLAQRSASAAKEIKDLIASSVSTIEDGAQQANEVSTAMNEIKSAVRRVSEIIGEIACASEQQSAGIVQINQAVIQMDQVTQQNAALVEEAAAAAHSLEEEAGKLKSTVSSFTLSEAA